MSEREVEEAAMLAVLVSEVKGINKRLDAQNNAVLKHFEADAKWMEAHGLEHAEAKGYISGRESVRKSDLAVAGALFSVVAVAANIAVKVLA